MKSKKRVLLLILLTAVCGIFLLWKELSNTSSRERIHLHNFELRTQNNIHLSADENTKADRSDSAFHDNYKKEHGRRFDKQQNYNEKEVLFHRLDVSDKSFGNGENKLEQFRQSNDELGSFRQHNEEEVVRNVKIDKNGNEAWETNDNPVDDVNDLTIPITMKNVSSVNFTGNPDLFSEQQFSDKTLSKGLVTNETWNYQNYTQSDLPLCSSRGKNLVGPLLIDRSIPENMKEVERKVSVKHGGLVRKGGWYEPKTCKPRVKVAVIIPFRNRYEQLRLFLRHMHPFLQRQQLMYRIIVVEQLGEDPFNRAGLFNIGFKEALTLQEFDCFIFTDVDLLPEDDRNYYGCPASPLHMSIAVDKFNYHLPFATIFGGCGAFKRKDFEEINGMSNLFFGWGGEDDDLYQRITEMNWKLSRPSLHVGRYTMVNTHHHTAEGNPMRANLLETSRQRMMFDGLNTLKYELKNVVEDPLVTFVRIIMQKKMYSL